MDYLNPDKRRWHLIKLFTGYFLVAIAVMLAIFIMWELLVEGLSYRSGAIVQDGMIFVSSSPQGANISLNGKPSGQTNKRLTVPSGRYTIELNRSGYRTWRRTIELIGGKFQSYNYPFLVPNQLTSTGVTSFSGQPALATQSPDRNWLVVSDSASPLKFSLVNLKTPATPVVTSLKLPAKLLPDSTGSTWKLVEWANDNSHVLLDNALGEKHNFIVLDTQDPTKSVNLNQEFNTQPTEVKLFNQQFDKYWLYDSASQVLSRADQGSTSVTPYLKKVLGFKGYDDSIVLYARADKDGTASVVWNQGGKNYVIASKLPAADSPDDYLLDMAQFQDHWYVVAGVTSGKKVTVYEDPVNYINKFPGSLPPAEYVLRVDHPTYEKFSTNTQFIMVENGRHVAIFNALYSLGYSYQLQKLDAPQVHAEWIDGYHLTHVAGGQLVMSDFNQLNQQTLVSASPDYQPFFSNDFKYLFTMSQAGDSGQTTTSLSSTPLRLPADM